MYEKSNFFNTVLTFKAILIHSLKSKCKFKNKSTYIKYSLISFVLNTKDTDANI